METDDRTEHNDVALTPTQQVDLQRRLEEYRAGKARLIGGHEALKLLRNRELLGRRHPEGSGSDARDLGLE
jgi:hypothetical protein